MMINDSPFFSYSISTNDKGGTVAVNKPRITDITLYADSWVGEEPRFEQIVHIDGVTAKDQVDIKLTLEQIEIFREKKATFTTKNVDGVVTVGLVGQKLTNDYTVQVLLTEVSYV